MFRGIEPVAQAGVGVVYSLHLLLTQFHAGQRAVFVVFAVAAYVGRPEAQDQLVIARLARGGNGDAFAHPATARVRHGERISTGPHVVQLRP